MSWKNWRQNLNQILDLPRDVTLNLPKIIVSGQVQAILENHRGVVEYSPERVRFQLEKGQLLLKGKELVLRGILPEEAVVEGWITGIEFLE
ncbi:MAG: sporulation protein YqfC [Bacillota bacterium]